jgi:UDP-N-acetylglucosamine/UDP-N-acetylgalactosamine diphosphorylase
MSTALLPESVRLLLQHGVSLPSPHTVEISHGIEPQQIAPGVVIHAGCRIRGAETVMGPGCVIGAEGPATVENCQLGTRVSLAGGSFSGATFLDGASFGSCAHVRAGTLLEEEASCAHSVGLKQTLLMPFVVTGSLVNFCDCLMAGGTGRKNHSEVGSSYVHFNFTPHQDKATASLIGDVPRGVLLDQRPIFLGGQGGLVGPVRLAYGTTIAAGIVWRRDILDPGLLLTSSGATPRHAVPYETQVYGDVSRVLVNNFIYLGNLKALRDWYGRVRSRFYQRDPRRLLLFQGALHRIMTMIEERVSRLDDLVARLKESASALPDTDTGARQQAIAARWPAVREALDKELATESAIPARDRALSLLATVDTADYLMAIRGLSTTCRRDIVEWLQAEVNAIVALCPVAARPANPVA